MAGRRAPAAGETAVIEHARRQAPCDPHFSSRRPRATGLPVSLGGATKGSPLQQRVSRRSTTAVERTVRPSRHRSPDLAASDDVPNGLDWQAFSTRFFPGRRRHDLEVLKAYGAYRNGADEGRGPEEAERFEEGRARAVAVISAASG